MKYIRFVDPKIETFIKSRKSLKFHFGWKQKLQSLANSGDVVTVYYNTRYSSKIMVKNLGYNKQTHCTDFAFVYFDGIEEHESSRFNCVAGSSLYAVEPSVEETYSLYSSHSFTEYELACAEALTEINQMFRYTTIDKIQIKYDGVNDKIGHEEVVCTKELFIKYKGYNSDTNRKEFVFSDGNRDYRGVFEIVE